MTPFHERPRVAFIVGAGRSGSTILDQLLGNQPNWFSIGELHTLWARGLRDRDLCGCGRPVPDCPFWRAIITEVFGSVKQVPFDSVARFMNRHVRARPLPLFQLWRASRSPTSTYPVKEYGLLLSQMYRAIRAISGARVLIDSTKVPVHALVAALFGDVDLFAIHLVRDPRAVGYSWLRNPDAGDRRATGYLTFRAMSLAPCIAQWLYRCLVGDLILRPVLGNRYITLRYEDFVSAPEATLARISRLVGESPNRQGESTTLHGFTASSNHILAGNRSKFRTGTLLIQEDRAWASEMSRRDRALCVALAWPEMLRYGYPLSPH